MQADSKSEVIKTIFKDIALLEVVVKEAKEIALHLNDDLESKGEEAVDEHVDNTRKVIGALKDSITHIHSTFEDFTIRHAYNGVKVEPGLGKIKLVALSKLIDPSRAAVIDKPVKDPNDSSIVIVSDSGSDPQPAPPKLKRLGKTARAARNNNNTTKDRESKPANRSILKGPPNGLNTSILDCHKDTTIDSEEKDKAPTPRKVQFADPSRDDATVLSKITDLESSSDTIDSSDDQVRDGKVRATRRHKKHVKARVDGNPADPKFTWRCSVDLKRVPAETLLKDYLLDMEEAEYKRLTNLKNLKRGRKARPNSSSDSGDSPQQLRKKPERKVASNRKAISPSISDADDCNVSKESAEEKIDEPVKEAEVEPMDVTAVQEEQDSFLLDTIQPDDEPNDKGPEENDTVDSSMSPEEANTQSEETKDTEANKNSDDSGSEGKKTEGSKKKDVDDSSDEEIPTKSKKKKTVKKADKDKSSDEDDTDEDKKKKRSKSDASWKKDKLLQMDLSSSDSDFGKTPIERFKKKCERRARERSIKEDVLPTKIKVNRCTVVSKKGKRQVISDSDESKDDDDKKKNSDEEYADESKESSESNSDSDEKNEEKASKPRRRLKRLKDSSEEDEAGKSTRKNIRKVLHNDSLSKTTVQAERDETERKARIAERQKKYNNIFEEGKLEKSSVTKVVLDFNDETREELLSVEEEIVKHLKPHQGKGIQFMWDACFESLDRAKGTAGSGCILAHCMGLGKTLQVIALIHTLISNEEKTGVRKVLVVCPLSTVLNWVAEFKKWLPDDDVVDVFDLVAYKQNRERMYQTKQWHKHGGVLVLGYDMFRNLSNEKNKRIGKKLRAEFETALVNPGPDMVICDEGHLLKNEKTSLSICMNRLKTARRIVLTGTPLQNNMKEYFCMVQFVKPSLLGTYKEYLNRFVNPITNGQYTDSTQHDIQIMRKRSHVLHKLLDGVVQRRDYSVLQPFLPPKHEYVLFIKLTETQDKLYLHYLTHLARRPIPGGGKSYLFIDFQEFQRICTHPRVLHDKSIQNRLAQEKRDWENDVDSEGSLKDFLDDESDAASTSNESGSGSEKSEKIETPKPKRRTRAMTELEGPDTELEEIVAEAEKPSDWWTQYTAADELDNIIYSGKLHLLFEILHQCESMGDKILVFSQSLYSLNVIEFFLSKIDDAAQSDDASLVGGYKSSWALGLDYFRLDGSSSCDNRATWCKTFNDPDNTRARLFLISTRAGGLGINLVAANRVIIFDVSWNPSHDIQSIYRVYRFGQNKPTYVYRFVTYGTMEMKIYERQVIKQAISKRVIDEQQIDRHYNQNDLQELYKYEGMPVERPIPLVPKDILLGELLQNFENLIYKYHEHQSLLENKEDEVLDEEERKAAWEEFENEKKARHINTSNTGSLGMLNQVPMTTIITAMASIIRREHPTFTQQEINGVMPQLVQELNSQIANGETTMYQKILGEIGLMQSQQHKKMQEMYQLQQQQQAFRMYEKLQQKYANSGNIGLNPAALRNMAPYNQMSQNTMNAPGNSQLNAPIDPKAVVNIDD